MHIMQMANYTVKTQKSFSINDVKNTPKWLKYQRTFLRYFCNVQQLDKYLLIANWLHYRTFRAAGSKLWNSLPSDVVDCQTVDVFRHRLKHFFFNVSFS